jgi:adenylate cyclase
VRYVLEGSIQRSGERLRVTAQLIDGLQGNHLWAERYDRGLEDLFAVQDDITRGIASQLPEEVFSDLWARSLKKKPETFTTASDYLWRASAHLRRAVDQVDQDENRKAEAFYRKALELEPDDAVATRGLGWVRFFDWTYRWTPSRQDSFREMREYAERAETLGPHDPQNLWLLNRVYFYSKQYDKAFAAIERAVDLNPNNPDLLIYYARRVMWDGRVTDAAEIADKALRLNPNHPRWYNSHLGLIYNFAHRDRDAVAALENRGNLQSWDYRLLIISYVRLGDMDKARETAAKYLETDPGFSVARWADGAIKALPLLEKATDMEAYKADLIKAGLPE